MRLPSLVPWISACVVVALVAATPVPAQGPRVRPSAFVQAEALPAAFAAPKSSAAVRRSGSHWLRGAAIGLGVGLVAGLVLAGSVASDDSCDLVCASAVGAAFVGVALLGLVVGTLIGAATSK